MQPLPYRLALYHGFTMLLALVGAVAAGRWLLGRDVYTAARLLVAAGVVVLPATFAVILLLRRAFLPLLAHLGSRHHLPLDRIRSQFGLGAKLIAYLSCIALVTMGFVVLASSAAHNGPGAGRLRCRRHPRIT